MRLSLVATILAPAFAYAAGFCLSDAEAKTVGQNFAQLISNYSRPFADQFLYKNYIDQSDSVATLINNGTNAPIPLGSITFPSKKAYEDAQAGQPNVPFEILNLWHTCDEVIIRWVSKLQPQQVQGFTAMTAVPNPNKKVKPAFKYQISVTYGEFNSGAWLANLGRPECQN